MSYSVRVHGGKRRSWNGERQSLRGGRRTLDSRGYTMMRWEQTTADTMRSSVSRRGRAPCAPGGAAGAGSRGAAPRCAGRLGMLGSRQRRRRRVVFARALREERAAHACRLAAVVGPRTEWEDVALIMPRPLLPPQSRLSGMLLGGSASRRGAHSSCSPPHSDSQRGHAAVQGECDSPRAPCTAA